MGTSALDQISLDSFDELTSGILSDGLIDLDSTFPSTDLELGESSIGGQGTDSLDDLFSDPSDIETIFVPKIVRKILLVLFFYGGIVNAIVFMTLFLLLYHGFDPFSIKSLI